MNKETLSTSEKELPKHREALQEKYKTFEEKEPLNPDNIKISDLANGIKGLALTLGNLEIINSPKVMLDSVFESYKEGLQRNVKSKLSKGLDKESHNKLLNLNDRKHWMLKFEYQYKYRQHCQL